jgi:RNA polymerase sigma-70 factor (ECF subfamily)
VWLACSHIFYFLDKSGPVVIFFTTRLGGNAPSRTLFTMQANSILRRTAISKASDYHPKPVNRTCGKKVASTMAADSSVFDSNYVNALRQGEPAIQAHFVNHFSPLLLRAVSRKVRCADQAREIRQETFRRVLTIVQSDRGVRQPERFEVFVIGVCNNVVRESYREQSRSVALSELEAEPVNNLPSAYALVQARETREKVRRVLSQLGEADRTILRAVFLDNQDKDEVCRRLGVTRDYLRVLLYRAKERFRVLVQKDAPQKAQWNRPEGLKH